MSDPAAVAASITIPSPSPQARWNYLRAHLDQWYYALDYEALEITLAAAHAHYAIDADPVWLTITGVSGSAKTSTMIQSLSGLPNTRVISDLTPRTFISHFQGKTGPGLLSQIGKSGLLLFKDLTTLLSKREDDRAEVIAQLREIYDGKLVRYTGTADKPSWEGKITVIAACTPALERAWGLKRDLGERFVNVRWPRNGSIELARYAARQRGNEAVILATTQRLGKDFASRPSKQLAPLPDALGEVTARYAQMTATLRANVSRDSRGRNEIIDIPSIEEPTRLNKTFELIVSAYASLYSRDPEDADLRLAKRVAWDSVPFSRELVTKCFSGGQALTVSELSRRTSIPATTTRRICEDLEALGVLTKNSSPMTDEEFHVREDFAETLRFCF